MLTKTETAVPKSLRIAPLADKILAFDRKALGMSEGEYISHLLMTNPRSRESLGLVADLLNDPLMKAAECAAANLNSPTASLAKAGIACLGGNQDAIAPSRPSAESPQSPVESPAPSSAPVARGKRQAAR